jgi:hypothetical protein
MSFKLPIHDSFHKDKDPSDATCQHICPSVAHTTTHNGDTHVRDEGSAVCANCSVDVAVKEDLEDYGSDSDSDSNFVSSTNTSDTDPDTDSDEDEDSFDDFEDVDNSGSGEHEQGLPHHFPATADTSTA